MFAFIDPEQRIGEIHSIGAQRMTGHLAVEDFASNIGVISRNLAPAFIARISRDADEADELAAKRFELADFHGEPPLLRSRICHCGELIKTHLRVAIFALVDELESIDLGDLCLRGLLQHHHGSGAQPRAAD